MGIAKLQPLPINSSHLNFTQPEYLNWDTKSQNM